MNHFVNVPLVLLIGKPALFWQENSIAVVILLLSFSENVVVVKTPYQNVRSFIILCSGDQRAQ